MGFYDSLAQAYGIPGVNMTPGFAQDIFLRELGNYGDRMYQRGMNPTAMPRGPMVGDIQQQMVNERLKQQQALEAIQREIEMRQFDEAMKRDRLALDQEKFLYGQERDEMADKRARDQMQTQRDVAEIYRTPRAGTVSAEAVVDRDAITGAIGRYQIGEATPDDIYTLLDSGFITASQAGAYGSGQSGPEIDPQKLFTERVKFLKNRIEEEKNGSIRRRLVGELEELVTTGDIQEKSSPVLNRLLDSREEASVDGQGIGDGKAATDLTDNQKTAADQTVKTLQSASPEAAQEWLATRGPRMPPHVLDYIMRELGVQP